LDIHSHASLLGLFIVGNAYDDVYRFERHTVFPKILSQICQDFSHENTIYNNDLAKEGTARRYFCNNISPEVNTYTLEASLLGYTDPNFDDVIPFTDDMYCRYPIFNMHFCFCCTREPTQFFILDRAKQRN
jgi:hypothetical protein